MTEPIQFDRVKRDAESLLANLRKTMEGVMIELNSSQRRTFEANDFLIQEFRRLTNAIEELIRQLARFQ